MKTLEPPDLHYVSAAVGWLELGNWREAAAELNGVSPALASHPAVLALRYDIHVRADRWDLASDAAAALTEKMPDEPGVWTKLAFATRRKPGGGIPSAKIILSVAHQRFPTDALIAYNLACYECQLGNLPEARVWLQEAFKLGENGDYKKLSLSDPDLAPLRLEIELM